jgi:inhibitor of KinA sporulation pathway (predicted exonuclease)
MGSVFNQDFEEFIHCLNEHNVAYLLVGGYSVILHGYNRTTGDMDIWVKQDIENYNRLLDACSCFQLPVFDMTPANFMRTDLDVFRFGRPPVGIDILTAVKGLQFSEAYANAEWRAIDDLKICVLSADDLKKAKKAANRPKDQDDLEHL